MSTAFDGMVYSPHTRQELVMLCPINEILYGGSAGSGKSFCIIFSWLQHESLYGWKAKGLVLRKTNPELEDLIQEFKKVFSALPNPPKWNETKRTFTHQSGSVLEMGYLDVDDDKYRYHGRQFTFLAWDELTLWHTPEQYDFLRTRTRSAHGVPVTILSTTNPIGAGAGWVMNRWKIDQYPDGMKPIRLYISTKTYEIYQDRADLDELEDWELPEGIKRWTRIFIPGKLADNPSLDQDGAYRSQLMMQPEKIRKALLEGRWDSVEGAFFEEWDPKVHVVKHFNPPKGGRRWMALDWGTAKPYCALWGYDAPNGEIYVYDELYGWGGLPDKGTMEPASVVAQKILARERERGEYIVERYMDPSCFSKDGHEVSISDIFRQAQVHFQPGPRRNKEGRIALLREKLKVVNGNAQLKIMNNCAHLIRTLPRLQFDTIKFQLYDTKSEDHAVDALLYLLIRNRTDIGAKQIDINGINAARLSRFGEFGVW